MLGIILIDIILTGIHIIGIHIIDIKVTGIIILIFIYLKINTGEDFMQENRWIYSGVVERVVDGDTFDIIVDLGFGIKLKTRFRLARVDTPEVRGEEREQGLYVTRVVEKLIEGKEVLLKSYKKGSFGRYLAEIWIGEENINLSDHLLAENLAKPYIK